MSIVLRAAMNLNSLVGLLNVVDKLIDQLVPIRFQPTKGDKGSLTS